jgi:hypothetical protein
VIRADEDVARKISQASQAASDSNDSSEAGAQVFSDPVIEPFGPPE